MESVYESWCEEKQSSYIYIQLAEIEKGTPRERLFLDLSRMAEEQALVWQKGQSDPRFSEAYRPTAKVKFVLFLARRLGPRRIKPILAALKVRGLSVYSGPHPALPAKALPQSIEEIGDRHKLKGAAGNLRAAVFGMNDGLISNASLMVGVAAAAHNDPKIILMTGAAGLFAGALSMSAGEYISVRSQREMLEYQLGLERAELAQYPEEEAAELALIYQARGVPKEQAHQMAVHLIAEPEHALQTLAREELGLDPNDLGSPWGAAFSSFFAFAVGGLIPLFPFIFSRGESTIWISVGFTGVALFLTGAFVSLFSGRGLVYSGLRMFLIGGGAGLITFLIGSWFGVNV